MTIERWEPFREMISLRDAMNSLLAESFVRPGGSSAPGGAATQAARNPRQGSQSSRRGACSKASLWQEILSLALRHKIAVHFVKSESRRDVPGGVATLLAHDEPQWAAASSVSHEKKTARADPPALCNHRPLGHASST